MSTEKDPREHYKSPTLFFLTLVSSSIILFTLVLIYMTQFQNRSVALVNQTYQRATVCFLSVAPSKRTDQYIDKCYDQAEKETGQKVHRYTTDRN